MWLLSGGLAYVGLMGALAAVNWSTRPEHLHRRRDR
jgi:hypothetical protein